MLEQLIPVPRKVESDSVDLAAPPDLVWAYVRHADLGDSPLTRALFALRTLPSPHDPTAPAATLCIDQLRSSVAHPGFQLLGEDAGRELTVGAIGRVWQLDIPFEHVADADAYARFARPGWIKVAWSIRLEPLGQAATRLRFELRVDATDEVSWRLFTRYWHVIGPSSHFLRALLLSRLRDRFGSPEEREETRPLPGDERLVDVGCQLTHGITMNATPQQIWPWLLQMGCRRGGFYAIDSLDNGGKASAREVHTELQNVIVGDIIPATPNGTDGFEVLAIDPERALVLGGLFDVGADKQLRFGSTRPIRFWQITWAFVLEPLSPSETRLHVRARVAFSPSERLHLAWLRPVHALMQTTQLRHLAARAEGRLAQDTPVDIAAGVAGAAIMTLAWLTPFLRPLRNHWGLTAEEASSPRPGDDCVPQPRWSWTHALDVDASAEEIWPWLAQLGADRAGFYSYQWLENLAKCNVRNAETIHPEWAHKVGDDLLLHPTMPPLRVVTVEPGRSLVAVAPADEKARNSGKPWAAASWAFLLDPRSAGGCRVVSRFRSACSDDLATRLMQGPALLEPVGFAMDRRMLLGIRDRVAATRGPSA
jgi:hypothetical protein